MEILNLKHAGFFGGKYYTILEKNYIIDIFRVGYSLYVLKAQVY